MCAQHLLSQDSHEPRNQRSVRKLKATFANVQRPIVPSPGVDLAEPHSVQAPDVGGCEPMIGSIGLLRFSLRSAEQLRFNVLHLAHPSDAEQVSQNAPAGARLKL